MKEVNINLEENLKIEENNQLIQNQNNNIGRSNNNINEPLIKDDIIQINKNENEISLSKPSQNNINDNNNQQNNINLINNEINQNNINQNNNPQNIGINQNNNLSNFNSQMNYQVNPNSDEVYNPLAVEETACISCCSHGIRAALFGCGCAWFVAFIFFYAFIFKDNRYYY